MKYQALFCADLHIKRSPDEQFALAQIVSAAIKNKVSAIVAAGDLLDRQTNRSEPITFFLTQLNRLREPGIKFYYLRGQHDYDDPPWLASHENAVHMHKHVLDLGCFSAYGLDYQPYGKLQEELAEIPTDCSVLVAHQTWGEWMGSITSPQGELCQVPGHVTTVFTGDLHKHVYEMRNNAAGKPLLCISPGATAMQKIDEPREHYCYLLDASGAFHSRRLYSRQVIDWPVMNYTEDFDRFVSEIEATLLAAIRVADVNDYPAEMRKPYLRITYSHRLTDVVRRVTKLVNDRAILYWKELPPEEKQAAQRKVVTKGSAVTPLSLLETKVDKDEEPEVFALASLLLSSTNPEEDFQRWWTEAIDGKTPKAEGET